MAKTSADVLWEEGRAEGKAEGKAEGESKGKRETLLRQLRRKFGALPPEVEQRIQALTDIPRLDDLLDRILTAGSIEEMGV